MRHLEPSAPKVRDQTTIKFDFQILFFLTREFLCSRLYRSLQNTTCKNSDIYVLAIKGARALDDRCSQRTAAIGGEGNVARCVK